MPKQKIPLNMENTKKLIFLSKYEIPIMNSYMAKYYKILSVFKTKIVLSK